MFHEHILLIKIGGIPYRGFCQAAAHVPGPTAGWRRHASASVCFDASSGNCWPSSEDRPWATVAALSILQAGVQKNLGACVCWRGLEPVANSVGVWKPCSLASRRDRACAIVHATGAHRIRLGLGWVWNGHFLWLTSPVLLPNLLLFLWEFFLSKRRTWSI